MVSRDKKKWPVEPLSFGLKFVGLYEPWKAPSRSETTRPANCRFMHEVKVIFFDAVGTLIHLPRGVGFHYAEVARRLGWNAEADSFDAAFRAEWKGMPRRPSERKPRADDDRAWWRELVLRVLRRREPPPGFDQERYFDAVYREFTQPGVWSLFPEAIEVLDELVAHYRLAILSNFDARLRTVLAQLGILARFTEMVISSEVAKRSACRIQKTVVRYVSGHARPHRHQHDQGPL